MNSTDLTTAIKEQVIAKRFQTKRVTELQLECGHLVMAINPIHDSHVCYFCSYPRDKGLMKLERRWLPKNKKKVGFKPNQLRGNNEKL